MIQGLSKQGLSKQGLSKQGFSKQGFSKQGLSKQGLSNIRETRPGKAAASSPNRRAPDTTARIMPSTPPLTAIARSGMSKMG